MIRARSLLPLATLLLALAWTAAAGPALSRADENLPVYDHLRCYKARDSARAMALADLITNEAQRELLPSETGCSIVVNSEEFCVPVDKQRKPLASKDAPWGDFQGFELKNDFLCYKVRCTQTQGAVPESLKVIDQFGPHNLSKLRTSTVCTPAYKEAVPVYETPILEAAVVQQQFNLQNLQVSIRLLTSESQEYYLPSIANTALPTGWTLLSASEDLAARNCPPGIPALGEEGNFCNQYWDLVYQLAPNVCDLNGNHSYTFDVDCNPVMSHCNLVNPAAPDATVDFVTWGSFCASSNESSGARTHAAPIRFTAVVRRSAVP